LSWNNCCDYLKNRLQKLQYRAARIITGKVSEVTSEDVLKELDCQPLNQRHKTNKSIFMHRIQNEKMPSSTSNMFKIRINDRYHLRSNNNNYDLENLKQILRKRVLVIQLHPFGMTYQLQQKKKALALTNLNV
jgi:hypothetical protein